MSASSPPLRVTESHSSQPNATSDLSPNCPFCAIIQAYPQISPLSAPGNQALDPNLLDPEAYVLLSTEHVIAFLDIGPLTRGHTLVCPRKHREKIGHLSPEEGAEMGRVLPLLGRAVTRAVLPDITHDEVDYNIVQNNGPGAAQVVPHVHYHIVPRPPLGYKLPPPNRKYPPNKQPQGMQATAILFGRGHRHYRDDEDAETLGEEMRRCIKEEWQATMLSPKSHDGSSSGKESGGEGNSVEDDQPNQPAAGGGRQPSFSRKEGRL